jgi:ankyrin repeat protein
MTKKPHLSFDHDGKVACVAYNRVGMVHYMKTIDSSFLIIAASRGNIDMVTELLNCGVTPTIAAVESAVINQHMTCAIAIQTRIQNSPESIKSLHIILLILAINNNNIFVASSLLDHNPSLGLLHDALPIKTAIKMGDIDMIQCILSKIKPPAMLYTSLVMAISNCMIDVAKQIKNISQLNVYSVDILNAAICTSHIEVVQYVLDEIDIGDINASNGWALLTACKKGYVDIAALLIEHGADPTIDNDWPIVVACHNNQYNIIRMLIQQYNLSIPGYCISVATMNSYTTLLEVLLANKSNINELEDSMAAAMMIAIDRNDIKCVSMLAASGAQGDIVYALPYKYLELALATI